MKLSFILCILPAASALAALAPAQAVHWAPGAGGNGHWYEAAAVPGGVDWTTAVQTTSTPGQHLVTLANGAENAFVFSLINTPGFWQPDGAGANVGPWIGAGIIPSGPNGPNWFWVTAENFSFTAWAAGQPDGTGDLGGHYADPAAPSRSATWGDRAATADLAPGYVVEYEFMMDSIVPGAAGGPNGLFTYWGTPGKQVHFLASTRAGATAVPGCGGLVVNLSNPTVIATAVTNSGGAATKTILIQAGLSGRGVFFQAVERAGCRTSNLIYEVL